MDRRRFLQAAASLPLASSAAGGLVPPAKADLSPFDRAMVRQLARDAASKPFKAPDTKLPDSLKDLDYDHYRQIRFLPDRALWRGEKLPFEVQFFHRGFFYAPRVDIYEVAVVRRPGLPIGPDNFSFGSTAATEPGYGPRLRRLPASRSDQPARLLRRGLRLSGRELFPRGCQRRNLWALGAGIGDQHRRGQRAKNSPSSRRSGSKSLPRTPIPSSCTHCWTARAPRPPIVSPSGRAIPRSSTWKWPSIRASRLIMPALRR